MASDWIPYHDYKRVIGRPFLCRDTVWGLRLAVFETGYGNRDLHGGQRLNDIVAVYEFPLPAGRGDG